MSRGRSKVFTGKTGHANQIQGFIQRCGGRRARQGGGDLRNPAGLQRGRVGMGGACLAPLSAAAGDGAAGVQLRAAPRGGCRPHCRDRQRDAQADAGGQAAGRGWIHVLAGALNGGHPGIGGDCRGGAGAATPHGRGAGDRRRGGHADLGGLSAGHCDGEPDCAAVHLSRVCAGERRGAVCRGGLRHVAGRPRISVAAVPAHVPDHHAKLAHVSAGRAVWAGLRHGHRDWTAGHLGGGGIEGAVAGTRSWCSRCCLPRGCR